MRKQRYLPPEEPLELYKTGFDDDDLLGRAEFGKTLSEYVERIEDPLVIALMEGGAPENHTSCSVGWAHTSRMAAQPLQSTSMHLPMIISRNR